MQRRNGKVCFCSSQIETLLYCEAISDIITNMHQLEPPHEEVIILYKANHDFFFRQGIEQLKKETGQWKQKSRWLALKSVFGHPFSFRWFSPFHSSNSSVGKRDIYLYTVWIELYFKLLFLVQKNLLWTDTILSVQKPVSMNKGFFCTAISAAEFV